MDKTLKKSTTNPLTKRKIDVNGKTFNQLLANGWVYDGTNIIQPNEMHQVMRLPELLLLIFDHLDDGSLRTMRQVSKLYSSIALETRVDRITKLSPDLKMTALKDYHDCQKIAEFMIMKNSPPLIRDFIISLPTQPVGSASRRRFCDIMLWQIVSADVNMDILRTIIPYVDPRNLNYMTIRSASSPDIIRLFVEYGLSLIVAIEWVIERPDDELLVELLQKGSYLFPGITLVSPTGQLLISREDLKHKIHQKWLS